MGNRFGCNPNDYISLAFQAGRYQDAIVQSQVALAMKPEWTDATWGMGISNGMLGQCDEAIANFASALEVDKGYGKAKDGLQWAKDNQKAAKQGKIVKDKPPLWN